MTVDAIAAPDAIPAPSASRAPTNATEPEAAAASEGSARPGGFDRTRRRQLMVASAICIAAIAGILGLSCGYTIARGARPTTEAARGAPLSVPLGAPAGAAAAGDAARVARLLRSLPLATRYELQAAQLRVLFSDSIFPVARVAFTRIPVPDQPPPTVGSDVTLVTATDAAWRHLRAPEREIMLAALAASHARFLAAIGEADTTRFVAMLATREANGTERVLALRDRYGRLYIAADGAH